MQPQAPAQETGTVVEAGRAAASHVGALQELLDQLLMHWQARLVSLYLLKLLDWLLHQME